MSGLPRNRAWLLKDASRLTAQRRLEDTALVARRLAHDFNNVLTAILGFSELCLSVLRPTSPGYGYAAEVHRAAREGEDFTRSMRWFSRCGERKAAPSSLADAVAQETEKIRREPGVAVQIQSSLPDALPRVAADAEEVCQVIRHALNNAREAVSTGGKIAVTAFATDLAESDCRQLLGDARPGAHVAVTITDNGGGLTRETRERLFIEPFFSTKPRHRGMGLAIIFGILRSRLGGFRIGDADAGGTQLQFFLPVALRPSVSSPADSPSAPACEHRILVVDDDPMVLQLVRAMLEQAGFAVTVSDSVSEALAAYKATASGGFQLVLCDVLMPSLGGVALARELLTHDPNANVLFMSSQAQSEITSDEFLGGRFGVLSKPFRPETLLRAVRNSLRVGSPCPVPGAAQQRTCGDVLPAAAAVT